jgi:hypothetical protein
MFVDFEVLFRRYVVLAPEILMCRGNKNPCCIWRPFPVFTGAKLGLYELQLATDCDQKREFCFL